LSTTYGTYSVEPHYINIPHRIYAEQYLSNAEQLIDFKFHCLNGEPEFVLICSNRKADGDKKMSVTLDTFDMDWNPIFEMKSIGNEIVGEGKLEKPKNFDEMKRIAKLLSKDFSFVRVDLYELNGKIYFGEMTFTDGAGFDNFRPRRFDETLGNLMDLKNIDC
jgi:hypothetical protein